MTCDELLEHASDVVDGGVSSKLRTDADRHLATCERCRALVADLRLIRQTAAALDHRAPPAHVWSNIATHLQVDPRLAGGGARRHSFRAAVPAWSWMAAAAVLVVLVGGGLFYMARSIRQTPGRSSASDAGGAAGSATGNTSPTALVESIESELQLAADHYEKAIAGLERVANQSDSPLDPELTATLRRNLGVIDKAIAESRTALRAQPDSRLAQESLFEAFRRKIALLQDTIALMNEVRKGNQAGAARIVEGLNKS